MHTARAPRTTAPARMCRSSGSLHTCVGLRPGGVLCCACSNSALPAPAGSVVVAVASSAGAHTACASGKVASTFWPPKAHLQFCCALAIGDQGVCYTAPATQSRYLEAHTRTLCSATDMVQTAARERNCSTELGTNKRAPPTRLFQTAARGRATRSQTHKNTAASRAPATQ